MDTTATHWERHAPAQATGPERRRERTMDAQWAHFASLVRIYIIVATSITLLEALFTPESLNWMAMQLAEPGWRVAACVVLAVNALMLLDAIVNDWLPAGVTIRMPWETHAWTLPLVMRRTWHKRYILLLVTAVAQMAMGYLIAEHLENAWIVMVRIGFDGAAACGVALFDIVYRHQLSEGEP